MATESDSLRSAILVGSAQLAMLTAENDLRVANAWPTRGQRVANGSLTRAAGSATTVTASPDDTLDTPVALRTEAELATLAGDGPAVRLATFNVAVARAAKRSQKSTYLPTLTMSYSYAFSQNAGHFVGRNLLLVGGDNASRETMNLNIAYQLFNGFARESPTVQADVALTNAEAQLRDVQLAARQNLTLFLRSLQNARARV